ncbi:MAG: substrate-binding domain-containing protein [Planctomycetota bacterium]
MTPDLVATPVARRSCRARFALLAFLAGLVAACGEVTTPAVDAPPAVARPTPRPPVTLAIAGFSATREVLGSKQLPAFAKKWRREHEQPISFNPVFAGSEALTDVVMSGFAADLAMLALPPDMDRLVDAGLVRASWREAPNGGIVCRSAIAFGVRKGNPKGIRTWADLARPDVRVVSPDPATSGGGISNLCAVYGAALRGHAGVPAADDAAARAFVVRVLANVVQQHKSTCESFRAFQAGLGDVAITYESEIVLGWMFGHGDERVVPASTLLVEHPAALLDRHVDAHEVRGPAEALLAYLWSPEAQRRFAACGLRPVDRAVAAAAATAGQFPQPEDLWTIEDLGGWDRVLPAIRPLTAAPTPATPAGR